VLSVSLLVGVSANIAEARPTSTDPTTTIYIDSADPAASKAWIMQKAAIVGGTATFTELDGLGYGFLATVPSSIRTWLGVNWDYTVNGLVSTGLPDEATTAMPTGGQIYCSAPAHSVFDNIDPTTIIASGGNDRFAKSLSTNYNPVTDPYSAYNAAVEMGAPSFWSAGYRGRTSAAATFPFSNPPKSYPAGTKIDVAVVDTGISPVNPGGTTYPAPLGTVGPLDGSSTISGPDFSFESMSQDLTHLDSYGHGTHMAGIIHTIAPDARIVNVKVGDGTGATDVTQVMAALDWIREHRTAYGLNIRVISLSYGTISTNDWRTDELSKVVDKAWKDGIVVVAAAGNNNDPQFDTGVNSPAFNKNILAVGAYNTNTDPTTYSDDALAYFSNQQTTTNTRLPDVGAPGTHITSWRVPGAQADFDVADELCHTTSGIPDVMYPIFHDSLGRTYLRGSGTSQATALAAGAAALIISKFPGIKPDELKRMMKANAHSIPMGAKSVYGDGAIDLKATFAASVPTGFTQNNDPVTGGYGLEGSRGGYHLFDQSRAATSADLAGCIWPVPAPFRPAYTIPYGVPLCNNRDVFGRTFSPTAHAMLVEQDKTWPTDVMSPGVWNGTQLIAAPAGADAAAFVPDPVLGQVWPSTSWTGMSDWAGTSYITDNWTGNRWSGNRWSGNRWSGSQFVGNRWSGNRWSGNRWSGNTWRSNSWSSADWK
jgi:serine protease AprX